MDNKKAVEIQEGMRASAHQNLVGCIVTTIAGFKFEAVAQAGNRTAYYVDGIKATKAQQLEALQVALVKEQTVKDNIVTCRRELESLPPGTYTVAGEAAAKLAMQMYKATIKPECLQRRRQQHLLRSRQSHANYKMHLMDELFHITRTFGVYVRITGTKGRSVTRPKRPCVAKRLSRLLKIYNTLAQ